MSNHYGLPADCTVSQLAAVLVEMMADGHGGDTLLFDGGDCYSERRPRPMAQRMESAAVRLTPCHQRESHGLRIAAEHERPRGLHRREER